MKKRTLYRILTFVLTLSILGACVIPASATNHPFRDVPDSAWYAPYVEYVYENGLMYGVEDDEFGPGMSLTRGMLVAILYRLDGSKAVDGLPNPFQDVSASAYYYDSVRWAYNGGIVSGVSDTSFEPDSKILRQEITAIFYRYANYLGLDTSGRANLSVYPDVNRISSYAVEAFQWAVAVGVISGSDGYLQPRGNATRAEAATILKSFARLTSSDPGDAPSVPEGYVLGWNYRDGKWYYVRSDGTFATGRYPIGSATYVFDDQGVLSYYECDSSFRSQVNAQPLNPQPTGIPALDDLVQSIFSQIFQPNYTTYDKLLAIYHYEVANFEYGFVIDLDTEDQFNDVKVFKSDYDSTIACMAYSILTNNVGVCNNFAAAFAVMTRAIGLEGYVVSGRYDTNGHAWNNVRVNNTLYAFDAQSENHVADGGPSNDWFFAMTDEETPSEFKYYNREAEMAEQKGFQEATEFVVAITVTDATGTREETRLWNASERHAYSLDVQIDYDVSAPAHYKVEIITADFEVRAYRDNGWVYGYHQGDCIEGDIGEDKVFDSVQVQDVDNYRSFYVRFLVY